MGSETRRYSVLGVLGSGGFGRVYRARLEGGSEFSKDVAIKVLHEAQPPMDMLQRFRDEARILGLIRDRAIVSVDPPIRLGGRWAVVMDYVDGSSCSGLLKHRGPFPPGVAVEIAGEVARVLDKAYHFIGPEGMPLELLHRDIKPGNIQITPTGEVRLLDFGVARASFSARESKTTNQIAGTPGYMAPERLSGIEDPSGDVYSLGVVLWVLLTGERAGQRPPAEITSAEIEQASKGSEYTAQALRLAAEMRHPDHRKRPSARDVERRCRSMRQSLPEPWLREWAEGMPDAREDVDDLVGRVLSETLIQSGVRDMPDPEPTGRGSRTLVFGGAAALVSALLGMTGVAAAALGVVAYMSMQPAPTVETAPPLEPATILAEPSPAPIPTHSVAVFAIPSGTLTIDGEEPVPLPWSGMLEEGPHTLELIPDSDDAVGDAADALPGDEDGGAEAHAIELELTEAWTLCWDFGMGAECGTEPEPPEPVVAPRPSPTRPAPRPVASAQPEPRPQPPPTQPEPQPVARTRLVDFISEPWGATVEVDGKTVGTTPMVRFAIAEGDHEVLLYLPDGPRIQRRIRVGRNSASAYRWNAADGSWVAGISDNL